MFYILYFLMIFSVFSAEQINACDDNVQLRCVHHHDETGLPSLLSVHRFLDEQEKRNIPDPCAACWLYFTLDPDNLKEAVECLPTTPWLSAMQDLHKNYFQPDANTLGNLVDTFRLLGGTNREWLLFCETQKKCSVAPIEKLRSYFGTFKD